MSRGKGTDQRWLLFVEAFTGVAAGDQGEAARLAGFKGKTKDALSETGRRLLKRPEIQALIAEKQKANPLVKDGDALRKFWSDIVDGHVIVEVKGGRKVKNTPPIKERVRASEMLAKAQGLFIKKVEVEHKGQVRVIAEIPDNGRGDGG